MTASHYHARLRSGRQAAWIGQGESNNKIAKENRESFLSNFGGVSFCCGQVVLPATLVTPMITSRSCIQYCNNNTNKILHLHRRQICKFYTFYMLASRNINRIFPKERIIRISVDHLHLLNLDRTTAVSTLAPSSNSKSSPTRNLDVTTSRARHISRHLSIQTSQKLDMTSLPVSEKGYHANAPGGYTVRKNGAPNTLEHRIYVEKDGVPLSPFHDIPLYANEQQTVLNMIVEIPRWTNAKMEVSDQPCKRASHTRPSHSHKQWR